MVQITDSFASGTTCRPAWTTTLTFSTSPRSSRRCKNCRPRRRPPHLRGARRLDGRWRGDHEHHARFRDRTLPRDRPTDGGRSHGPRYSQAIPGRGGRPVRLGGRGGAGGGAKRFGVDPRPGQWPTESSALAVAAAVGVSVTVGIVFGYYPAWKARGSTRSRHYAMNKPVARSPI